MVNKVHIVCLLVVFSFLLISKISFPQYEKVNFEHIRVEDGLPVNSVTCILQDHLGFLWLGTQSGLVKYDGYSMTVYRPETDDTSSISGGNIRVLCEDHTGTLWVGTKRGGLNRFDRATETFTHYKYSEGDTTTLNSNNVKTIYNDKDRRLWIGTDTGLNLLNTQLDNFSHYFLFNSDTIQRTSSNSARIKSGTVNSIIEEPISGNLLIGSNLPGLWSFNMTSKIFSRSDLPYSDQEFDHTSINAIHQTKDGTIWMGTSNGLARFDQQSNQLHFFQPVPSSNYNPVNDYKSMVEDQSGLIWVGTYGQGLACFNPQTEKFQRHQYDKFDTYSLYGYWIFSLYEDRSGILWVGIDDGGLDKWDKKKWKFKHYKHNPLNSNSLCENWVASICEDNNGMIWVGTEGGLNKYDRKENIFKHYFHDPLNPNSLSSDSIWSIVEDPDESGVLWIGTWKDGLNKFDLAKRTFTHYQNDPTDANSLSHNSIISMLFDHDGLLWIGTWGGGLNRFDRKTNRFTSFQHDPNDPNSLSHNQISIIYEDRKGTLWIGTDGAGLNRFERNTETFIKYRSLVNDDLPSSVMSLYEDQKGNFWIGTYRNGLYLFDRNKGVSVKNYDEKNGLANNFLTAILEDDSGNLWISTSNGISTFNPITESFRTYGILDGLAGVRFNRSSFKSQSGEMLFGGQDGLNIFHPDSVRDDPFPPQVLIDKVSLFNRPGEKLAFEKYISELDEIKLTYNQNDLRFDFVGLHYGAPEKNIYAYKLENYNDNWIDASTQRNATFTNLDPGEYIFRVKAANRDGIWNEEGASIKLIILPPLWATTFAYIVYALLVFGIIYVTWKLQVKRIRIKHGYEMSRFEAEKLHEVDEMKSRFFANISHEFRTPLTLIFGPAKDISEKAKDVDIKQSAGIIRRNASRLHGLVNQLLDLSKLEAGRMTLEASEQNIIPLLKGLVLSFTSFAERKKITLKLNTVKENIDVYIDKDKVEKIITNILSNAFKFTHEGGKIDFTVEKLIKEVEIKIIDNGVGIPKERIDKIFDRFYQVDGSHTRESEGTGIGLALTKELVELHKGKIKVESKEGEGTTFTVLLPLGKEHLKSEEICEEVKGKKEDKEVTLTADMIPEPESRKEKADTDLLFETDKPLLLIVEDNTDVRKYIINHLEDEYRIQEAVDGADGLEQSVNHIPDLIITDVMMPKMDGFELCSKLKTDERTSHIPIIILTAKATSKDKIEGYETGADDYIMKPFDEKELRVRIKNLIDQRKKLRENFKKEGLIDLENKNITSVDKIFLQRTVEVIDNNLSDSTFGVESFARELAVSRSLLHKKLVALIGEPPSEIIKRVRLRKAAKLIENKAGNISEIALEIGFNNPAYFSECFKKQFGESPLKYQQRFSNH
jgi:signal transduction histidine kinase/ligand-binding sensor domain-containing protein/DNA-binding response OmpR family regulator